MLNRWQRTIVDLRGNVVPYAQLQILREQTQSAPIIYRDKAGTEAIPNAIVTANQNGYAYFYAPADLYRIRSTQPTIDWRDVDLGSAAAQQLAQQALDNAVPTYETLVDMQADTGQPVPTLGRVVNDSTLENNGYYVWTGTTWERAAYQPLSDMDVSIEPAPSKIPRATGDGVIREAWVEDLPFNYDQIYAQLWLARYPGIPAPSFYQEFGGGASLLDPRITFSRSGEATYIKNGRMHTAGVGEPVFEDGGLRVWSSVTNLLPYANQLDMWSIRNSGFDLESIGAGDGLFTWSASVNTPENVVGLYMDSVLPDVDGKIYTYTCYVKRAESFEGTLRVGNHTSAAGKWSVEINADGTIAPYVVYGEALVTEYDAESGFLRFTFRAEEGTDPSVFIRADTSEAQVGDPVFKIGNQMVVEGDGINPFVPTDDTPETMPADNARIRGSAFQQMFNPQEGAVVVDATVLLSDKVPTAYPVILGMWGAGGTRLAVQRRAQYNNSLRLMVYSGGNERTDLATSIAIDNQTRMKVGLRWDDQS